MSHGGRTDGGRVGAIRGKGTEGGAAYGDAQARRRPSKTGMNAPLPCPFASLRGLADAMQPYCSASAFYAACAVIQLVSGWRLRAQLRHVAARDFPVLTCPSWLPARALLLLQTPGVFAVLCCGSPPLMLCAAVWPGFALLRLLVAVWLSLYALSESCVTHSHRDHASVYCAWALAMLPAELARGVALGVCVVFIASSGFAKLHVASKPGTSMLDGAAAWCAPGTMRTILRQYAGLQLDNFGPLSPTFNAFVRRHDLLLSSLAASTLIFECVAVPAALVMPPTMRLLLVVASCSLHMGIAVVQSLDIGTAFLPNLGTYLLGFGAADATPGSAGWWCALGISAAGAVPLALRRRLVAEDWPLSPFALFAFSGRQWDALFTHLDLLPGVADRRTRLVLGPAAMASPVGCAVVGRLSSGGSNDSDGAKVVYNGWEQVIGETLVFNEVLDGVDFDLLCKDAATAAATSAAAPPLWAARLAEATEAWLEGGRLLMLPHGEPLRHAWVVALEADCDVVSAVFASGRPHGE